MTNEQNIIAVPVPVNAKITGTLNFMGVPSLGYDMPDKRVYKRLVPDVPHDYLIPMDAFLGCVSFKDGEYIFDFGLKLGIFNFEDFFIYHLQSMGHYWVNPLGEKPIYDGRYKILAVDSNLTPFDIYNGKLNAWRAAQEKCLRPDQKLAVMKIGG